MKVANRAILFALAGGIGFLVDAGILLGLVAIGADARVARILSIAAAMTTTWWVNRKLAFGDRAGKPRLMEFVTYVAASALGAVINYGVYFALITWGEPFSRYPILAVAIATAVAMGFNFWSYLSVVFRRK